MRIDFGITMDLDKTFLAFIFSVIMHYDYNTNGSVVVPINPTPITKKYTQKVCKIKEMIANTNLAVNIWC